ncbi:MAG: oligosaccharide flippase family protein [Caldilineaceae bacterium]|nr:oligosaccharide flippase family protein [Caldilineaceae bacterium]
MLDTQRSDAFPAAPAHGSPTVISAAQRMPRQFGQRLMSNRLLSGSALFFVSTTIVNGGNYLFNLILGRWLGPAIFADVSTVITLFLLLTFVTAGFQQTAAKFAATFSADQGSADPRPRLRALRIWLNRRSWAVGGVVALVVGGGAPFWQSFFHTSSPWIFVIFACSLPFYFVQGIDRGLLQGQMQFATLAASYQAEMWTRLLVGLLLVAAGWAAAGAVAGLALSIVVTWFVADYSLRALSHSRRSGGDALHSHALTLAERQAIWHFALPVLMVETSLILINNSDVLIVKRFFDSVTAGHYAALALIGRIVFFGTWSVVITMFPLVAQKAQRGEAHRSLLWLGLGLVLGVSVLIIGATVFLPELLVQILFGANYMVIAPLLWLYATATALFALANVIINYHLALGNRTGSLLALVAGSAQVVVLVLYHATLYQVVVLQIVLMAGLLFALLSWDLIILHRAQKPPTEVRTEREAHSGGS